MILLDAIHRPVLGQQIVSRALGAGRMLRAVAMLDRALLCK